MVKLLVDYKFYVPQNCRIFTLHLYSNNWEVLADIHSPIHSFNAEYIQDFARLVNERRLILDFSNIETITDELFH